MRALQADVLQAVLGHLRGEAPAPLRWPLGDVRRAGLATGLTALAATLGVFATDGDGVAGYLTEQGAEVAARHARFTELTPRVLAAFAAADLPAVPVKGAVLGGSAGAAVWPQPATRPMSDIDLLVPVRLRAQAAAVLVGDGFALHRTDDHEDTFLAWGDGSAGRTDGESAAHNGRIEVHPGWVELLHGYLVHGFELEAHLRGEADGAVRLTEPAFAVHVVGHLASTVVRAEVRAVNLVDVWFLHRRGLDWTAMAAVMAEVDPRLTAPGLWLADRTMPGVVPADVLAGEMARLPGAAALRAAEPAAVLRDPGPRTTTRWRLAHATGGRERVAVLRQVARSARGRVRGLRR